MAFSEALSAWIRMEWSASCLAGAEAVRLVIDSTAAI
jgi:hypothetical protein